jgi:outer membrane protein, heavy metal efflux system
MSTSIPKENPMPRRLTLIGQLLAALVWCVAATPQLAQAQAPTDSARARHNPNRARANDAAVSLPSDPPAAPTSTSLAPAGEVPTLELVLGLARERAPEVIVGLAEVESSRAATVGARLSPILNPYLEVIAERGHGVTRDVYVTAQLHTPIEISGQRSRRIAEADASVDWHGANLEQQRARVLGAAVRTYGQGVTWGARLETLTDLLHSATTESEVLKARRDVGDATDRDAQLAEVERARIAVQLDETRASLSASLMELQRLTGRRFVTPNTSVIMPQVSNWDLAPTELGKSAPIVRSAEAESRYFGRVDERLERERIPAMSVILQAGRGDLRETRLGFGLAWTLPTFRYNQGERARAQAEGLRARATAEAYRSSISHRLAAIVEEGRLLRVAVQRLDQEGIPAAMLATNSATRMQQAGKIDLLSVVVARRDLYVLRLRRLELAERAWGLLGDWVELTGKLPR